jgi:hypothetical protein
MADGPEFGGEIDIPKLGKVKKSYLVMGGVVVVAIVGVWWYKQHQSATAAQQQGADVQAAVDQAMTPGSTASGSTVDSTVNTTLAGQLPTDNGTWIDTAISKATTLGIDAAAMTAAISKWMAHQTLTQDEANLVNQARALVGEDPPVGGPYPVNITSTPTPPTNVAPPVPHLTFQSGTANAHGFTLVANGSPTATSYHWRVGAHSLPAGETAVTSSPVYTFTGGKHGVEYWANVHAVNAAGDSGGSNMLQGLKTVP